MIKINIKKDTITIEGHSGYKDSGSDIVCASVSSICITTVNALLSIDEDCLVYSESDGYLKINVVKHDKIIDILIDNMINLLKELELKYNKYIEIR